MDRLNIVDIAEEFAYTSGLWEAFSDVYVKARETMPVRKAIKYAMLEIGLWQEFQKMLTQEKAFM